MAGILPPFNAESALAKVKAAEKAWNTHDADAITLAYTQDTQWRNRGTFLSGREEVREWLRAKFAKECGYELEKTLFSFSDNRISVHFQYEYYTVDDSTGRRQWWRAYGNENWTFDRRNGLMAIRNMSANDVPIREEDRRIGVGRAGLGGPDSAERSGVA